MKTRGKLKTGHVDGQGVHFTRIALPEENNLFLLVSYLVFSFLFSPNPGDKCLHRYINCKFQLSLQKEKTLNPQNKHFGLNQINF